jgi:predicted nucleotidyltransferase
MTIQGINFDEATLAEFCRRHRVSRLSLFGSILTEKFRPDSDVDVLVEFEPGAKPTLFYLGGMLMELRELLGRDVDLRTAGDLSPYFRDDVMKGSKLLYAA